MKKLELGNILIHDVQFSNEGSKVENGVLYVNKEEICKIALEDENIASCEVFLARPGESVRITPVKDIIEPRVKVEGKGGIFPGWIAKVDTVGEGRTHVLKGAAVVTTGKIVDYGVKDSMNMGACMAPAAADVIAANLNDFQRKPEDYDQIITGDLGEVGRQILLDILQAKGYDIADRYIDCGIEIYRDDQNVQSGGSGCGCSAVMLTGYILQKLKNQEWKRVLFVPTGALLSPVSFNEGKSVPGIAHAVILESAGENDRK